MAIRFGENQYGKVDCRVLRVDRGVDGKPGRNAITDLSVTTTLAGDFDDTHLRGDNRNLLPTDSHRNAVFTFAKSGIGQIEDFGLRLARYFVDNFPTVRRARIRLKEFGWERYNDGGFIRGSQDVRTATITYDGTHVWAIGGLTNLALFQSVGSQFHGFAKDAYTTLPPTKDRTYATLVTADWRHERFVEGYDWAGLYQKARASLIETFLTIKSQSTQQVLYTMGHRLLEGCPTLVEVRLNMPNLHHLHVDLTPFGLENEEEVLYPSDRPYGLMEGTILRDDAPEPGLAWWGW